METRKTKNLDSLSATIEIKLDKILRIDLGGSVLGTRKITLLRIGFLTYSKAQTLNGHTHLNRPRTDK